MEFITIGNAKKLTGLSYIGRTAVSAKLEKSEKVDNVATYCVYLAPHKQSGYNVCSHATPECIKECLATSGRAGMEILSGKDKTIQSRIKKTRLFHENQEFYMNWLIAEIKTAHRKATNENKGFAVRLNGTSDIDWANVIHMGKNIFDHFPEIMFYDYTKNHKKFLNKPLNYDLTLSYTGRNWEACKQMLNKNVNIAMIFNLKVMPKSFEGFEVIDGDITDLRIKDKKGIIVGLHWKRIANKAINLEIKEGIFVIQPDDNRNEF